MDPYATLGVSRDATSAEIKVAFRALALRWHPDRNPGDPAAEGRFKEIARAYGLLSDGAARARYDRGGGTPGGSGMGGLAGDLRAATEFFESVFGELFGFGRGQRRGQDLRYTLEIGPEAAARGTRTTIVFARPADCAACAGAGAEGGAAGLVPCAACQGRGVLRERAGYFAPTRDCGTCGGTGEVPGVRCGACGGTGLCERDAAFEVTIPPGAVDGHSQRVEGEGAPGRRGGPPGDLFVVVRVRARQAVGG